MLLLPQENVLLFVDGQKDQGTLHSFRGRTRLISIGMGWLRREGESIEDTQTADSLRVHLTLDLECHERFRY